MRSDGSRKDIKHKMRDRMSCIFSEGLGRPRGYESKIEDINFYMEFQRIVLGSYTRTSIYLIWKKLRCSDGGNLIAVYAARRYDYRDGEEIITVVEKNPGL